MYRLSLFFNLQGGRHASIKNTSLSCPTTVSSRHPHQALFNCNIADPDFDRVLEHGDLCVLFFVYFNIYYLYTRSAPKKKKKKKKTEEEEDREKKEKRRNKNENEEREREID